MISAISKDDDEDDDEDVSWLEKRSEYTHLETKAYGVDSIYYIVSLHWKNCRINQAYLGHNNKKYEFRNVSTFLHF